MTIIPLMPWIAKPSTSGKTNSRLSTTALSSTPPSITHLPSPATAYTIAIAWMTTSAATMYASTL